MSALLTVIWVCPAIAQDEESSRGVRIIDGPTMPALPLPPVANPPPTKLEPSAPADHPPTLQSVLSDKSESVTPGTASKSLNTATPNPAPDASALATPSSVPPIISSPAGAATAVVANPAGLSIEMLPESKIPVGSRVSFRISAKEPGYLILVDVDATGRLTQIYPSPGSLMSSGRGRLNSNFVKPGKPIQIPSAIEPYAGFEFVASPPLGTAMVVAMLSDQPVQMIDLPDIPVSIVGQNAALAFLSKLANELRIPSARDDSRLQRSTWSLNAKFYEIRPAPN
jgi:hypothetical protein